MKKLLTIVSVLTIIGCIFLATTIQAQGAVSSNSTIQSVTVPTYFIAGDANGDGRITIGDITKIEREVLKLDSITQGADANRDGKVDMGDVVKVERYILQLDFTVGDVDHSGQVDQNDVTTLEKMILGEIPINSQANIRQRADWNNTPTIADITALESMINKK